MSDLQELIHKSSMAAYQQGVTREKERIIQLIKEESGAVMAGYEKSDWLIALIEEKGETRNDN